MANTGWRNKGNKGESYRHALAAKGIKTKHIITQPKLSAFGFPELGRDTETPLITDKDMEMTTRGFGRELASSLKSINDPLIQDAYLDDFGSYSGRVFVQLKASSYDDSDGRKKYYFGGRNVLDSSKNTLRSVNSSIRGVMNRLTKHQGFSAKIIKSPQRIYRGEKYEKPYFTGYDSDEIIIDYER
jgi:hypothetical protein